MIVHVLRIVGCEGEEEDDAAKKIFIAAKSIIESMIYQIKEYFTHVQSKIVTRSVPEIVRFILYEVTPKQMKEANKKHKAISISDPANEGESYMEMVLRVEWDAERSKCYHK
ncbi:PREDICTED: uncharacterized protein LOC101300623 [Fragaria vesca subsp. vesca]|uniref:uncharacterized protein LOC101300623 n=1 Tax=Fragaria vesca subsp. vesca TaxID=101020 RepID=UPI0002C307BB|nr:PREDICTED: uncharacterized protein LOC101300623 [Fragaria vesca subsp. vesca]